MGGMEYRDFVNLGYNPGEKDLVCNFYFRSEEDPKWAAGAVAAESSIGTWDPELSTMHEDIRENGAVVFGIEEVEGDGSRIGEMMDGEKMEVGTFEYEIEVAYPEVLFEAGNLPQILSSITGNIYGLDELENLRLDDVRFTEGVAEEFHGPSLGIEEIKDRAGAEDRPLVGTIVKPKLGLTAEQHAGVARKAWSGGLDIVKDDENLASMEFNEFYERVEKTLKAKREAEEETGEKKIYFPNVTAPVGEMKKRADAVVGNGGRYVMIDILTAGWSSLQEMREYLGDSVGIHAHRAQHAAYTRLPYHGISMMAVAKFARLSGVDNLHAGSVVGKMEGGKEEVVELYEFLRTDWLNLENVIPVASGGLHPGLVPELVDILGRDIVIQAGGGVHGHPDGTRAGAKALRKAVDEFAAGGSLSEAREKYEEIDRAVGKWGTGV
ncbi:MAG: ribulose-bisphosphate carboxylase large subunit [Halobacteria archaeon]